MSTPEVITPDSTKPEQPDHLWKPGESGNPNGRPKGTRNKFGEALVKDFLADWEKHGTEAIIAVREKTPDGYLRAACAILPKIIELDDDTKDLLKEALTSSIQFDAIRKKLDDK